MGGDLIQTPQTRWIQGAYESVQRGTPLHLVARVVNGAGEQRYSVLRLPGAAGGYQVTAGKTLFITRLLINNDQALNTWIVASGTNDVGSDSLVAPTDVAPEDSAGLTVRNALTTLSASVIYDINYFVDISTGRYAYIRLLTGSTQISVSAFGHEE